MYRFKDLQRFYYSSPIDADPALTLECENCFTPFFKPEDQTELPTILCPRCNRHAALYNSYWPYFIKSSSKIELVPARDFTSSEVIEECVELLPPRKEKSQHWKTLRTTGPFGKKAILSVLHGKNSSFGNELSTQHAQIYFSKRIGSQPNRSGIYVENSSSDDEKYLKDFEESEKRQEIYLPEKEQEQEQGQKKQKPWKSPRTAGPLRKKAKLPVLRGKKSSSRKKSSTQHDEIPILKPSVYVETPFGDEEFLEDFEESVSRSDSDLWDNELESHPQSKQESPESDAHFGELEKPECDSCPPDAGSIPSKDIRNADISSDSFGSSDSSDSSHELIDLTADETPSPPPHVAPSNTTTFASSPAVKYTPKDPQPNLSSKSCPDDQTAQTQQPLSHVFATPHYDSANSHNQDRRSSLCEHLTPRDKCPVHRSQGQPTPTYSSQNYSQGTGNHRSPLLKSNSSQHQHFLYDNSPVHPPLENNSSNSSNSQWVGGPVEYAPTPFTPNVTGNQSSQKASELSSTSQPTTKDSEQGTSAFYVPPQHVLQTHPDNQSPKKVSQSIPPTTSLSQTHKGWPFYVSSNY